MNYDLSILIPSRNEMFLRNTIEDILAHKEASTEVIALLDGQWPTEPIPRYNDVNIIYMNYSIGQRAGADMACKLATGKYIMKVDAHCSFDQGFDRKMLEGFEKVGDNVTMVPVMRNLWAFDWVCDSCGWKKYQGPTPDKCEKCGKPVKRKMMWVGKERPQSKSYSFDSEPHFRYNNEYTKRPVYKETLERTGFTETMSLQGSCFMCTKERYFELELGEMKDEIGSWGNQGIQIACATWLSGGRVLVNHNTWYAHMFRTQGGDFGFPYHIGGRQTQKTKDKVRDLFWDKKHPKQIYPVSWLVEKFWPVRGWSDDDLKNLKEREANFTASKK